MPAAVHLSHFYLFCRISSTPARILWSQPIKSSLIEISRRKWTFSTRFSQVGNLYIILAQPSFFLVVPIFPSWKTLWKTWYSSPFKFSLCCVTRKAEEAALGSINSIHDACVHAKSKTNVFIFVSSRWRSLLYGTFELWLLVSVTQFPALVETWCIVHTVLLISMDGFVVEMNTELCSPLILCLKDVVAISLWIKSQINNTKQILDKLKGNESLQLVVECSVLLQEIATWHLDFSRDNDCIWYNHEMEIKRSLMFSGYFCSYESSFRTSFTVLSWINSGDAFSWFGNRPK